MKDFVSPSFQSDGFNCPNCNAFTQQNRHILENNSNRGCWSSICSRCNEPSIWFSNEMYLSYSYKSDKGLMIYPDKNNVPNHNEDLSENIKKDYNEAASILQKSPRGACALLRLAMQKLMIQVGESGENINNDIKELVKKGLNSTIQKALDIVRVTGNNAVHPGELDLQDNIEIASSLFGLINIIADYMITQPKLIQEQYSQLPQSTLQAIEKRDGKS